MSTIEDRIRGCLYGALIGDALGATWEFRDARDVPKGRLDIVGGGPFHWQPGVPTDDGDQTLIVARVCAALAFTPDPGVALRLVPDVIQQDLVTWYEAGPPDIGNTTAIALMRRRGGLPAGTDDSRSNGAMMRAAPIGCLLPTGHELAWLAKAVAGITHSNVEAQEWVATYTEGISMAVEWGTDYQPGEDRRRLRTFAHRYKKGKVPIGADYAAAWLALWALQQARHRGPVEALDGVIRLGGDTDTTGCIAGALLGATYGMDAWPNRWVNGLATDSRVQADSHAAAIARARNHLTPNGWYPHSIARTASKVTFIYRLDVTKRGATALLKAEGLDWTAPAVDIDDTLLAAGWTEAQRERAMGWLA